MMSSTDDEQTMTTDLIKSVSISNLLQTRDAVLAKLNEARRLVEEAQAQFESFREQVSTDDTTTDPLSYAEPTYLVDSSRSHRGYSRSWFTDDGWGSLVSELDARMWDFLMRRSGMDDFLDAQAKGEWAANIEEHNVPPLTRETIAATFQDLHNSRGDLFERGVCNVFRKLSWHYKTNNPVKFGAKLVLSHFRDGFGFSYDRSKQLDDLVRAFHVLDGKPVPEMAGGIARQLRESAGGCVFEPSRGEAELPYFRIKWFKKGTAHLFFSRPDLVDELNAIVAKHHPGALPASQAGA